MKKIPIHKVLRAGLAIYILCFSIGICFIVKARTDYKPSSPTITDQLTFEGGTSGDGDQSKSKTRFGSRFVSEEDDDDSDKGFYGDIIVLRENSGYGLVESNSAYLTNPRNIPTPPPWC